MRIERIIFGSSPLTMRAIIHGTILLSLLVPAVTMTTQADETINIAYPPFEPFYTFDAGIHKGICPDTITKIFSEESGIKFNATALPLPRIIRDLSSGRLDMAGCLPCSTPEVKDVVTVSAPYFSEDMLVVYPQHSTMRDLALSDHLSLEGVTVKDAITESYINPEKKFLLGSWSSVIQFIQKGRADYAVIPKTIYNSMKRTEETDNLISKKIDSIEVCMSISNKSPLVEKIEAINLKIALLKDAGSWMKHDNAPN